MRRRFVQLGALAFVMGSAAAVPQTQSAADVQPLIGANYSHKGLAGCDFNNEGIIANGTFTRPLVKRQLAAMRAAGIETLRLFVWHMHDASNQFWGVVTSAGGQLGEAEQRNLVNYATDVRLAGFKQLTVVFGPMWTNDPIGFPDNRYDPSLFQENWDFVKYVRQLVKQYGPTSTHFDLLNEGAPSDYLATKAQLEVYLARLYSNYVDTFGNQDVTVSSIVAANDQSRIRNLIDTLRATGRPLPTWFELHAYSGRLLEDLRVTDATLTAKGLAQPITIGETHYNDADAAKGVKDFTSSSPRRFAEVIEWPLRRDSGCRDISVAPPYKADAFVQALTGSAPSTRLSATVGPGSKMSLMAPYGNALTALEAGEYTLAVTDLSTKENLHLSGPGVNLSKRPRFRGTTTWPLVLKPGLYRYRSDRPKSKLRGTIFVLATG